MAAKKAAANNALARQNSLGSYLGNYQTLSSDYNTSLANNALSTASAYQTAQNNYAAQLANAGGKSASTPMLY